MRILLHAPMHTEYSAELGSALHNLEATDEVRLVVCGDFEYESLCDCPVVPLYADYSRKANKLTRLLSHFSSMFGVAWMLLRWRPDVFHAQDLRHAEMDWPLLIFARLLGISVVWTAHNSLPHERRAHHRILYGLIYRVANRVIVHTRHTARALELQSGVAAEKIHVIAHGNLLRMTAAGPNYEEARRELNLPPNAFVLLFFGRIRPYKGLDLLLEAVRKLQDRDLVLIVAGENLFDSYDGPEASATLRLDLRRIDEASAARYFRAADLLVLPYRRIDQSGVLMLGMSYGCAILATEVGGLAEVIENGRTGFLVPPEDAGRLADKIAWIRDHPERLADVRAGADRAVHEDYGWDRLAEQTVGVYGVGTSC